MHHQHITQAGSPRVLAPAATGVATFISRFGGDPDSIFGTAGIAPETIGKPTENLGLANYCALFEEAARQTHADNIGLWFGQQFQPSDLGMLGYVAVHSATLEAALQNFTELFPYHQSVTTMRVVKGQDLMRLEYRIDDGGIVRRRQDAELSLGMFVNIFRHCHGASWAPQEVHFEHPKPEGWAEHEKAFDAPVYFGQQTNALLFRAEELDRPMPSADLRLLQILRACLTGLGSGPTQVTLVSRIKSLLRGKLPEGYPSLEQVADDLNLPIWTVQRRLADEGLSYKDLVEETRRELAMLYLEQRHVQLSELAFMLGYSELSAFSRAFRRWTGMSPKAWRNARLGKGTTPAEPV